MKQSILFLLFLLHSCTGDITNRLIIRYCDVLKMRCDALPYRTVYHESNCYFIIDAKEDSEGTAKQCSQVLRNAKLARAAPDEVWSRIFAEKKDHLLADSATGNKKKAMCIYENVSPCVAKLARVPEGTCSARAREQTQIGARFIVDNMQLVGYNAPALLELPEPMKPGQELVLSLTAKHGFNELEINLQSVGAKSIQLQILFYITQGQVYLNSFFTHIKGAPEIQPFALLPKIGQPFEIRIRARENRFKICIDGKDFAEYKYRQALSFITNLEVKGHGFLNYYKFGKESKAFPSVSGPGHSFPVCKDAASKSKCTSLVVTGTIGIEYTRVTINLVRKNDDIALHFNPRYDEKDCVVLDSFANNIRAGQNERHCDKFAPKNGERIEVEFVNREKAFEIYVNGDHFANFTHRISSLDIANVEIFNIREPVIAIR